MPSDKWYDPDDDFFDDEDLEHDEEPDYDDDEGPTDYECDRAADAWFGV